MTDWFKKLLVLMVIVMLTLPLMAGKKNSVAPDPYYKEAAIFKPTPNSRSKVGLEVRHFGPVGLGLEVGGPDFTMIRIVKVYEGSPAAATGKLEAGQFIESINGKVLIDRDPRIVLGDLISETEAKDGKMKLKIKGEGEVVVQLEVMGDYSDTWPENCAKSDKIVRKMANLLKKQDEPHWGSILFLLSTGEEKDLEVVKRWMKSPQAQENNWGRGTEGIALCEYYLRTGDKSILSHIKKEVEILKRNMWNGSWNARGGPARYSYGVLNAAGVHCTTFLVMARVCGVEVDPYTLKTALRKFYRYVGHGNVPYGDHQPEGGFRDNGKTSGLAMTMAAAALLSPEGESSAYARARDISASKSFYATNWFRAAHTGGGIGEIWHHMAMNMIKEKREKQFRSYFDTRRWLMELSRRPDGSIGVGGQVYLRGNTTYDVSASEGKMSHGTLLGLTYTLHRKELQMFGAPPSVHAVKDAELKSLPWGNRRDKIFLDDDPIPGSSLTKKDVLEESVEKNSSLPFMKAMTVASVSDETLMRGLHHPEFGLRVATIKVLCEKDRSDLVVPLLKSKDARLRHVGLLALSGPFKGKPIKTKTPEMYKLLEKILMDEGESWWVTQEALKALSVSGTPGMVKRMADRIIELAQMDDPYIKFNATEALMTIAHEPEFYQKTIPVIVHNGLKSENHLQGIEIAKKASPEIKKFYYGTLRSAFDEIPEPLRYPGGAISSDGSDVLRSFVAKVMDVLPGGLGPILMRPKKTSLYLMSGKERDLYTFNGKFRNQKERVSVWQLCIRDLMKNHLSSSFEGSIEAWASTKKGKQFLRKKSSKVTYGLNLQSDGKVRVMGFLNRTMGEYVWSDNMLIGQYANEALRMEFLTVADRDFLIVEKFPSISEEAPLSNENKRDKRSLGAKGLWAPDYNVFIRVHDDLFQDIQKSAKDKKKERKAKQRNEPKEMRSSH
jgi:hypothetical protein